MIGNWLHRLTHAHWAFTKPGVGEVFVCAGRWPRNKVGELWFRPDLDGADWHPVPADDWKILGATTSPWEAMAVVRSADGTEF